MKTGKGFIFLLGAAIGGAAASTITYFICRKKYLEISNSEKKSLEDYIERLENERLTKTLRYSSDSVKGEDEKESGNSEDSRNVSSYSDRKKNIKEMQAKHTYVDYTAYAKNVSENSEASGYSHVDELYEKIAAENEHPVDSDEDEDNTPESQEEREMREAEEWSKRANSDKKPFLINSMEYDSTGYLDTINLYYYMEDGTLATEDDELIDDISSYVGDCLDTSGFKKDEEITDIYIRNYKMGSDYWVTKMPGKFSEYDY